MGIAGLSLLAQNDDAANAAAAGAAGVILLIELVLAVLIIAGMWKLFVKAGKPGWASIIPIYNSIVLIEIAGRPIWWFILLLIPYVGVIVAIIVILDVAKNFGKGTGFGLGMVFLTFIFFPLLGFSDAKYQPVVREGGA